MKKKEANILMNDKINVPKYYAVVRGKKPGIYRSEKDALNQINGFANPDMQVFDSEKDAIAYFNRDTNSGYTIPAEQVVIPDGEISNEDLGKFNDTSDFITVSMPDSNGNFSAAPTKVMNIGFTPNKVPDQVDVKPIAKSAPNKGNDVPFNPEVTCMVAGLANGFWGYGIVASQDICDSGVNIGVKAIGLEQIALSNLLEQLYILGFKDKKIEIAVLHKDMLEALDLNSVNDVPGLSPSKHNYIKKQLANFKLVHITQETAAENQDAISKIKDMLNLTNQLKAINE